MTDRYTVRRADDGAAHIYEAGKQWTQSAFTPRDTFDELVLQAVVDGLNGHEFRITGTALDVAERCRWRVDTLRIGIMTKAYSLLLQMMQEQGTEGHRPWRP